MVPAMVLASLNAVVGLSLFNWIYGLNWPVWGPALFAAVCIAVFQASMWYAEQSPWQPFCFLVPLVTVAIWFKSRYGHAFSMPSHLWQEVRLADTATMAAFIVISFVVATVGVARNRCGARIGLDWWTYWNQPLLNVTAALPTWSTNRFSDRKQAQFWSEWHVKGWVMPTIVTSGLVVGLAGWAIFDRESRSLIEGLVVGGAILALGGTIGGLIMGNCGRSDTTLEFGQFLATRPMSNVELASTVLKVAMRSVALSWSIWLVAFGVILSIMFACGMPVTGLLPAGLRWWYLPATLLGCWMTVGLLTTVGLTGRGPLMAQIATAVIAVAITLPLVYKWLSHDVREWLTALTFVAVGIAIVAATGWILFLAHRQSLISTRGTAIAALVWIVLCLIAVNECRQQPTGSAAGVAMLMALASLVVVPFAAAPLAVAWNRHR
jgi:hypothetical protein